MRLRGKWPTPNRERGAHKPAPSNAAPAPPAPTYSANVRTTVQPGQMVVTGGWNWTEGRRGVLLVTPDYRTGDDGQPVIEITHSVVLVPEELMSGLGWGLSRPDALRTLGASRSRCPGCQEAAGAAGVAPGGRGDDQSKGYYPRLGRPGSA